MACKHCKHVLLSRGEAFHSPDEDEVSAGGLLGDTVPRGLRREGVECSADEELPTALQLRDGMLY